jgi:hypothetical protein
VKECALDLCNLACNAACRYNGALRCLLACQEQAALHCFVLLIEKQPMD